MTAEELEKKAKDYADNYKTKDGRSLDWVDIEKAYKDGYKYGQEEIGYLKECLEENRGLKDTVIKLKAQIEKMKCCENCKHLKGKCAEQLASFRCENKKDWELAE